MRKFKLTGHLTNAHFPVLCKDTGEVADTYEEYLETDHWKNLRKRYYNSKLYNICKYFRAWKKRRAKLTKRTKRLIRAGKMKAPKKTPLKRKHKWVCQKCGSPSNLNLHHQTYKRLGKEWLQDLIHICKPCHTNVHKIINKYMDEGYDFRRASKQGVKNWGDERHERRIKRNREKKALK